MFAFEIDLHVVDEPHRFKNFATGQAAAVTSDPKWVEMLRQISNGEGKQRFIAALVAAQLQPRHPR